MRPNFGSLTLITLMLAVAAPERARSQAAGQADEARVRALAAAARSDLRNLIVAQEAYFADHVTYATSVDALQYKASAGITVTIDASTRNGWSGSARATGADFTCYIFVGAVAKPRPEVNEGAPLCVGVPRDETVRADSLQRMLSLMAPMFGNVMSNMYEGLINTLARPDVAERLAGFTRNYYDALVRRGFTKEEALRIVSSVGIPALR